MTILATAATAYRQSFLPDRRYHLIAAGCAAASVPLYVALAVLLEQVARSDPSAGAVVGLIGVAFCLFALEVLMDVHLIGHTVFSPQQRMQRGVLEHFLRLTPRRLPEVSSGDLSAAAVQYIDGSWFVRDSIRLVHALSSVVVLGLVIARTSWVLAAVAALPLLLLGAAVLVVRRRWVAMYTAERVARTRFETFLTDVLRGVLTIKLHRAQARSTETAATLSRNLQRHWLLVELQYSGIATLLNSLTPILIPLFLVVGGALISGGSLTAGQLVSLYVIFNLLGFHAGVANSMASFMLNDLGQVRHVNTFHELDTEGDDPVAVTAGTIDVDEISFAYGDGDPVLDGITLHIAPAAKIAVVGPSGGGKSTLLGLLAGMEMADHGEVRVDGQAIGLHNARALREATAAIGQSTPLFDTDLRYNLTLGADIPTADIDRVLGVVELTDFVAQLPAGMDTRFGAAGLTLSGGERARLCLARTLLRSRPLMLLDEVTAQVDAGNEATIMSNLLHHTPGVTLVSVSHRLSSVRDFPRIVLIDGGRVIDDGTHAQLMNRCPRYRELFGRQTAHDGPA